MLLRWLLLGVVGTWGFGWRLRQLRCGWVCRASGVEHLVSIWCGHLVCRAPGVDWGARSQAAALLLLLTCLLLLVRLLLLQVQLLLALLQLQ